MPSHLIWTGKCKPKQTKYLSLGLVFNETGPASNPLKRAGYNATQRKLYKRAMASRAQAERAVRNMIRSGAPLMVPNE